MITVQDWMASIPEEDKHIAYVGEGMSETREFLLCGSDWEKYINWAFHLDIAFDPESITTRDSRQVVQTTSDTTKHTEEATVTTEAVTTKETYTVNDVQVGGYDLTDVASLDKTVEQDGIRLTWTVLRQHTLLRGKLWANIRAVGESPDCIKKSAIMTFEVDPSISATPAAMPPISEFEQMEAEMDALRQQSYEAAEAAMQHSVSAAASAQRAVQACQEAAEQATLAESSHRAASEAAQAAITAHTGTTHQAQLAVQAASQAERSCQEAQSILQSAAPNLLPAATDNGHILQVANGVWKSVSVADSAVKTYIDEYISSALGGEY
ncbi:MAG: hypothetical protein IKL13_00580 [Clostridia bacterium]|nr:hypothetical protein [Clostridia bacterium]